VLEIPVSGGFCTRTWTYLHLEPAEKYWFCSYFVR